MQPSVSRPPHTLTGPWYRIQAITAPSRSSSAEWDFVTVLPAVLSAAQRGRPFVVGWMSRGGGAPLELITNAGPLTAPAAAPGHRPAGLPSGPSRCSSPAARAAWRSATTGSPTWPTWPGRRCPGRQAPPLGGRRDRRTARRAKRPTLFESTLVTLMAPAVRLAGHRRAVRDLLDAEVTAPAVRAASAAPYGDAERSRFDAERAERRMAGAGRVPRGRAVERPGAGRRGAAEELDRSRRCWSARWR